MSAERKLWNARVEYGKCGRWSGTRASKVEEMR